MASSRRGVEVITPRATLCYSHLTQVDDNGKFRAELVFGTDLDNAGLKSMAALEKASADLIEAEWPKKAKGKKTGIIRADQTSTDDDLHNECLGIIRPWSKPRDGVNTIKFKKLPPDKGGPILLDEEEVRDLFYDGCQVIAAVCPFTFDVDGNKGISWFLNQLLFVADGEPIGGGSAETDANLAAACGRDIDEECAVDSLL